MKNLDIDTLMKLPPKIVFPLMEPGDSLSYPARKVGYIRRLLWEAIKEGLEGDYITKVTKDKTTIVVCRIA